jgi:histidinol-phosphate aminotransferase
VLGGFVLKVKRDIEWLSEKVSAMRSFSGSLLSYVCSSPNVKDVNVLRLDANENFFADPAFLRNVFSQVLEDVDLRLYDPSAMVRLRRILGDYVGVPFECVGVGSGSEHLIDFIVRLFLARDDEAVSVTPSFFMYEKRVWLSGARLVTVPLRKDLSLDVEGILSNCSKKTRLIFICSPNNPTGNEFDWKEIEALADGSSAVVVVDEAYVEFGESSVSQKAVEKENVIVVRTFSKAFGLAGLRFGYFVANKDLAFGLSEAIPYTVSTVVARFVEKLLNRFEVVKGWIDGVKSERGRLLKELRSLGGIEVLDSKANFVTFRPKAYAERVYRGLLGKGVIVKDLGDLPVIRHCLRVTVGRPYMNDVFLRVLKEVLSEAGLR